MARREAVAVSLLVLAHGCASPPSVQACADDAQCGVGNLCHLGACAVNAPPSTALQAPASATTRRVVPIDATSSDPEARPVSHRWTVAAVEAGCAPEPDPTSGSRLEVVFWCAGTYRVSVVPVDDQGLAGAGAQVDVSVADAPSAPAATAGPPIATLHRCTALPAACDAVAGDGSTTFQLVADATDPDGGPLEWRWTAFPPEVAPGEIAPSVTFHPGPDVAAPSITIHSGGGRIAGRYRLRARATNAAGLLGQAVQEVTVGNEPPRLALDAVRVGHVFSAGVYTARATVPGVVVDPDGDPLAVGVVPGAAPAVGCTERVAAAASGAVAVEVACTDPRSLIGASPRTLTVTAADPNGGAVEAILPLVVENRPPVAEPGPSWANGVAAPHGVGPCTLTGLSGSCFVAQGADPFVVADPDGDPVTDVGFTVAVAPWAASARGAVVQAGAGLAFRLEAPVDRPAELRTAAGASPFSLVPAARDPWSATASAPVPVRIGNRPPAPAADVAAVEVAHRYDAGSGRYLAEATLARFVDPDGDPLSPVLDLAASGAAAAPCARLDLAAGEARLTCAVPWTLAATTRPALGAILGHRTVVYGASDPWEQRTTSTGVTVLDAPFVAGALPGSVEQCGCVTSAICPRGKAAASLSNVPLPLPVDDPDGDPVRIDLTFGTYPNEQRTAVNCLPGQCAAAVSNWLSPIPVSAAIDDGVGAPVVRSQPLAVTCATTGQCCPWP